jgi:two-component system response regulator RegA
MTAPGSILLVDDNEVFRERLARALRARGWAVACAGDYDQALASAAQAPPDRAVIDLRLPGRGGLEVVRDLHARCPAALLVVLTGYGSIATAIDAVRLGAINYLPKPADADEILYAFEHDPAGPPPDEEAEELPYEEAPTLERVEWEHIQRVLSDCQGNVSQAARILGLHRRTLQRKLQRYPPRR